MLTVHITSLHTFNGQGVDATLFDPGTDALTLQANFTLSNDVLAYPSVVVQGVYQIMDTRYDAVVVNHTMLAELDPALGPHLMWPLGAPTPNNWGLHWTDGDVFGFRAIIELFHGKLSKG